MLLRVVLFVLLSSLVPFAARANDCNLPTREALSYVSLPGQPFAAVPSIDGCWIFVSLSSAQPPARAGVAVLSRHDGSVALERIVDVRGQPLGMSLTHDGKVLVVVNGSGVAFVDVERIKSGHKSPVVGYWEETQGFGGRVYAALTPDDRFLFVTNEGAGIVTVLDLASMRRTGFAKPAVLGSVKVGTAPVGLAVSPDGRYVFVTSQMIEDRGWPKACHPEGKPGALPDHTEGAVVVLDVKRAVTAPAMAVINVVKAGCNPVRVVSSPDGLSVYVTARGSDALLVFTAAQLTAASANVLPIEVPVGRSPVGLAVIDDGAKIVVTNSDRFGAGHSGGESLYVIDARKAVAGADSTLGLLPANAFPREIRSTADGQTLLVTNFTGQTLEIVDVSRSPWMFTRRDEAEREAAADFLAFRHTLDAQRSRDPLHLCSRSAVLTAGEPTAM